MPVPLRPLLLAFAAVAGVLDAESAEIASNGVEIASRLGRSGQEVRAAKPSMKSMSANTPSIGIAL